MGLLRVLSNHPKALLLDEPTANLDPESEAAVWSTLEGLRGRTTMIAISHQPTLQGVADRIYRIVSGSVTAAPRPSPQAAVGATA